MQFPPDVQVFYVSPPSLNEVRRWMDDWVRRAMAQAADAGEDAGSSDPADPSADAEPSEGKTSGGEEDAPGEQAGGEADRRSDQPEYPY